VDLGGIPTKEGKEISKETKSCPEFVTETHATLWRGRLRAQDPVRTYTHCRSPIPTGRCCM
jgi:hypothetical protein